MDFYYPNIQNDMWRILGLLFFADKDYFLETPRQFSETKCKAFCQEVGLALGDTAMEVVRQRGNASDKYLEVTRPLDLDVVLAQIPTCGAISVTGQKAMDTLLDVVRTQTDVEEPPVGSASTFSWHGREMQLFRMPSSSRAYPKPLSEKAAVYQRMFESVGMLPLKK